MVDIGGIQGPSDDFGPEGTVEPDREDFGPEVSGFADMPDITGDGNNAGSRAGRFEAWVGSWANKVFSNKFAKIAGFIPGAAPVVALGVAMGKRHEMAQDLVARGVVGNLALAHDHIDRISHAAYEKGIISEGWQKDPQTGRMTFEGDPEVFRNQFENSLIPDANAPNEELSYLQRIQQGLGDSSDLSFGEDVTLSETGGTAPNMTDPKDDLWGHFLDQYFGVGEPGQEGFVPPVIGRMLEGADFRRGKAEEYVEDVGPYQELLSGMVKDSKPISFGIEGRPFKGSFTKRQDLQAGQSLDQLAKGKLALADVLDPSSSATWTDYIGNLQGMTETERAGQRGLEAANIPYEKEFSFRDLMTDLLLAGKGASVLKDTFF